GDLSRYVEPIRNWHVERAIFTEDYKDAFDIGRLYLEALDPKMAKRSERASARRKKSERTPPRQVHRVSTR
ncbi:MAG: hypothetical protein NUV67_03145, partial [archaeon]|nr:hypothetical protein [archaeon]